MDSNGLINMVCNLLVNRNIKDDKINCFNFQRRIEAEHEFLRKLIEIRNGITVDPIEYQTNGVAYIRDTSSQDNELKFSNLWKLMIEINNDSVSPEIQRLHDTEIDNLIEMDDNDPMWYDLNSTLYSKTDERRENVATEETEQVRTKILPKFRLCDINYHNKLLLSKLGSTEINDELKGKNESGNKDSNGTEMHRNEKLNAFQNIDTEDKDLKLPYDLNDNGYKLMKLSNYLRQRMQNELNPNYTTHPIMLLLISLLFNKARKRDFFSYGVRYLERYMNHMNTPGVEYHLPMEFRSNGEFVSLYYHSHMIFRFKYILNSLGNLYMHESIHGYEEEYLDVYNDVLLKMIVDVNLSGRSLKSAFNVFNLYYGLNIKVNKSDPDFDPLYETKNDKVKAAEANHLHPTYPSYLLKPSLMIEDVAYSNVIDCSGCDVTKVGKGIYTKEVRGYLIDAIKDMRANGNNLLANFCLKKLLYLCYNKTIIEDLIFIRMLLNSGGYAHTHKILDFDQIDENFKLNEEYMRPENYVKTYEWVGKRMYDIGKSQTLRLLSEGKYPTGTEFRSKTFKYVTSKSSGLPPVNVTIKQGKVNKKVRFPSKNAFLMMRGKDALDVTNTKVSDKALRDDVKKGKLGTEGRDLSFIEVNEICREYGISKIGSRSTVAYRDVRAIFINPIPAHFVQAALVYPHIEETTFRPAKDPGSMFIDKTYGSFIATQYMDGSADLIAPLVMSSAFGKFISALADASQWDQTFTSLDSMKFFEGVRDAMIQRGDITEEECYMYENGKGLNLVMLANWFIDFLRHRYYMAEYAGEMRIYDTNFMWSGRLDTFFLNCVQNECCNKEIDLRLKALGLPGYKYLLIAGDDMAAMVDASEWNAKKTEALKHTIVSTYREAGHVMNEVKSFMSHISGEFAKLYWYLGMMFRDPSIQLFEAEKNQKASTKIEYLRGYGQKIFEYVKRCKTTFANATLFGRTILGLSYFLDIQKSTNTFELVRGKKRMKKLKLRYIPPPQSIYASSFLGGGLGFTLTGITLNESLFIRTYLEEYTSRAVGVLKKLRPEMNNEIAELIASHYMTESELERVGVKKRDTSNMTIEYETYDPELTGISFEKGLKYRTEGLDNVRVKFSREAGERLSDMGAKLQPGLSYSDSGYSNFYDAIKSMIIDREASSKSLELNLNEFISINASDKNSTTMKIKTSSQKKVGGGNVAGLFSKELKIYNAFTFTFIKRKHSRMFRQMSNRYISAPDDAMMLEKIFGSKHGKESLSSLKGFQMKIKKFIKEANLPITELQVMNYIMQSGVVSIDNNNAALYNILLSLSGLPDLSQQTADAISADDVNWSSEIMSANIVGTVLENLHIPAEIVDEYVSMRTVPLSHAFVKMIKYSAFVLLIQKWIAEGECDYVVDVGTTKNIIKLLKDVRPFNITTYNTNSFEEQFVRSNVDAIFGNNMIDDSSL